MVEGKMKKTAWRKLHLLITLGLIALPVYFRGLYFEYEQFIVYMISFTSLILYMIQKKSRREPIKLHTYLDCALILLLVTYAVSVLFSVNKRLAVSELLKYVNYFVIYLLVKEFIISQRHIKIMLNTVLVSITGVSFIGIGAAAATFKYHGAYSEAANEQWINSTLQYHNAFGAFVMCGLLLCYALYSATDKRWAKILYSMAGFILTFGFIFSYSRGSWVIFPIALVLLVILLWKKALVPIIIMSFSVLCSVGLSANGFRAATLERLALPAWKWFFIGLFTCAVITVLLEITAIYIRKLNINKKTLGIAIIDLGTVTVVIILSFIPGLVHKLIPQDLLNRFKDIRFSTETVRERFVFYFDAFDIVKDYPIFGAGGGAWQSLYFMYQSYLYWSNQAHSYIMQVWVEAGTIGLLVFAAVLILFVVQVVKNLKVYFRETEQYIFQSGIFAAAVGLIFHSFIDFDLSLSGVSIVLWTLFALTSVYAMLSKEYNYGLYRFSPAYIFVPLIIMELATVCFMSANLYAKQAAQYAKAGNLVKAKEALALSVVFDPLKASYRIDYGNALVDTLSDSQKKQKEIILQAEKEIAAAVSLDPYNAQINASAGAFYLKIGNIERGLELVDKSVELQPLRPQNYRQVAEAYMKVVQLCLKKGETENVKGYLNRVISIQEQVQKMNEIKMKPVELEQETLDLIESAKQLLQNL